MINIEFKAHDFRQANAGDTLLLSPKHLLQQCEEWEEFQFRERMHNW
jgi:7,8-dihydro-6-hydroxymethylpterin-pyrophosphokinase